LARDELRVRCERFIVPAERAQRVPGVQQQFEERRLQGARRLKARQGVAGAAGARKRVAERGVESRFHGPPRDGALQQLQRAAEPAGVGGDAAEIEQGVGRLRVGGQHFPQQRFRFAPAAGAVQLGRPRELASAAQARAAA
jgi:hypothetical protein